MLETFVAYATASVLLMRMSHSDIHWLFNVESSQLIPAGRMCFDVCVNDFWRNSVNVYWHRFDTGEICFGTLNR
jgi:hypothetical protein